jgi:hypothetical protein
MLADHAGRVPGLDLAVRFHGNRMPAALGADQHGFVGELVAEAHLLARALDRQVPAMHGLDGILLGDQPQPLQRIAHRRIVAIFAVVADFETHSFSPAVQ